MRMHEKGQTLGKELTEQRTLDNSILPYSTSHFMSFRHRTLEEYTMSCGTDVNQEYSESDSSISDMSISTERSVSPYTSSSDTPPPPSVEYSPVIRSPPNADVSTETAPSSGDSLCSRETDSTKIELLDSSNVACTDEADENEKTNKLPKKNSRTNFTNEQVKALMKIFHETPYPDSEMMENIGKDLNITEKQVKIWFQNKRARWRRRVSDNKNNNVQSFLPTTAMSYGYMQTGHVMTSYPFQNIPGYMSYPWIQGYAGHNFMSQPLTGQNLANQIPYQTSNQSTTLTNFGSTGISANSALTTMSSAQYGQQKSPMQHRQSFQYPVFEKELKSIWVAIDDRAKKVEERVAKMEDKIESTDISSAILAGKVDELEKARGSMREEVSYLKSQSMRNNLIFTNVPEDNSSGNETTEVTERKLRKHLQDALKVAKETADSIRLERVHRSPGQPIPGKTRTIVAKFTFFKDRELIRRQWKKFE
ncbi:homeobox protein unc-42-like [Ruditapes philippinarum]|uniref:homeobox protein unc-42-like n=1 Tax=Ruditapes philippinarum TaxID=129788 RepID=UPI00295B9D1C|nr:homeobox protein unc-42-like [Ruditapes philippinarum]